MKHFRRIGTIDSVPLAAAVARHASEVGKINWREQPPGTPHPDTETLYLRMPSEITYDTVFNSLECVDLPFMADPAFENAARWVAMLAHGHLGIGQFAGNTLARVMIVKLKPGGRITP